MNVAILQMTLTGSKKYVVLMGFLIFADTHQKLTGCPRPMTVEWFRKILMGCCCKFVQVFDNPVKTENES
jgi:hypothetical protein